MAKKGKAARLPKKVGGVKLPKQFRKSAGVVAELAQSPVAREVVSAALVAGAAALAKRRVLAAGGQPQAQRPGSEFDSLIAQGKEVGNILAQGVSAFLGELLKPAEKPAAMESKTASAAPARKPAARSADTKAPTKVSRGPRTKPAAKPGPPPA